MTSLEQIRRAYPQYSDLSDGDLLIGLHRKHYSDMHPRDFLNSIEGATNAHATIRNEDLKAYWREAVSQPLPGEGASDTQRRLQGSADGPVYSTGGRGMERTRSAIQGVTFGAGDEIVAGATSALGGTDYSTELERERARLEAGREAAPVASTVAEIGGALALPGVGAQALARGSTAARMGKSAAAAGAGGLAYGFNSGEGREDRTRNALTTGAIASGVGLAAPVVANKAKQLFDRASLNKAIQKLRRSAPTAEELRAEAARIYAAADNVTDLPRAQFTDAAREAIDTATRRGLDPDLTPKAAKVADRMEDIATTPQETLGFRELDQLRRKGAVPAGDITNKVEQSLGARFIGAIDGFVDNLAPGLGEEVKSARAMWSRLAKNDLVEKAIDKAQRQASGFENGLRIEFRRILNNPKLSRGFTDIEKQVMEQIVQGTQFGNTMKRLGRLGVGMGQQTNALGASMAAIGGSAVGSAAGGPLGGLIGGVAAPALGTLAGRASEAATARSVGLLGDIVRAGGQAPVAQLSGPSVGLLGAGITRGARMIEPITR